MRAWLLVGIAVAALVLGAFAARRYFRGLSLVVRAADLQGPARRLTDLGRVPIDERVIEIPTRDRPMRARVYAPRRASRTVLLVSGLHPDGIDEPRLVSLSRTLAESSLTVVTPDIPELSRFEITPVLTDRIEGAAAWLAAESGLARGGRIGVMGISFSGGLSIVAAGRPSLRGRLSYVLSFGGHDDLRRVLEYFCAKPGAEDTGPPPHDFGAAVVLLNVAEHLVPAGQVAPLRDGVRRFLWASYLDRAEKPRAEREFAALRELSRRMPEPAATLLEEVNNRDVAHLGPRLLPCIGFYVDAPALSPSRSPLPSAPVFLLHGTDDNVIPAVESVRLAERLRGRAHVRLLLTDLVSHVDPDQPAHARDVLSLAGFWGDVLAR